MANHQSALKAHRQSIQRRERNRANRSTLRTALKRFSDRLEAGQGQEAMNSLPSLCCTIDKAVQKKALSENAAARQKSRLTRRLNDVLTASAK
jgi:small subunit ribosomal protein S20